jgi:hypothetical protein
MLANYSLLKGNRYFRDRHLKIVQEVISRLSAMAVIKGLWTVQLLGTMDADLGIWVKNFAYGRIGHACLPTSTNRTPLPMVQCVRRRVRRGVG